METKRAKRHLSVAMLWLGLIGIGALLWVFVFAPDEEEVLLDETGSASQYKHHVRLAADAFSGYAVLRSDAMRNELRERGIKLTVQDDAADYGARASALKQGKIQMAVFDIASFLMTGAKLKDFPSTIVMIIDESYGADGIVAYEDQVSSFEDLDSADARIVMTPDSPSEFLARFVLAHFSLPNLPQTWWQAADGAEDVYEKLKAGRGAGKRAYVLWEPYLSKALAESGVKLLLDSSKLKGRIVDVLVAQRKFLAENPEQVRSVVEAYLRAAYAARQSDEGMVGLVMSDAEKTETALEEAQASKLVDGVRWKNTLENYAHFGLAKGAKHLEDMIAGVAEVLVKTGALPSNPVAGKESTLFYRGVLEALQAENFHPGKRLNAVGDLGLGTQDLSGVQEDAVLRELSEAQWQALTPVGNLRVDPISFTRGGAGLTISGKHALDALAAQLEALPQYYVKVIGHARAVGDAAANARLAQERASSALSYLNSKGLDSRRGRALAAKPSGKGGAAQAVSFLVGQAPY